MNNSKHIIINVGRQLGSGGHIVAKKLAEQLSCGFYDRELLNMAAKESGLSEVFFEKNDEKKGFLESLFNLRAPFVGDNCFYNSNLSQDSLFQFQSDAIRKAAKEGSCVFVGRCADYVLRDMKNKLDVFITADFDERVERVRKRHDCTAEEAKKVIDKLESCRASYYNYYTGKTWGHSASYDLCINSSILGIDGTVECIIDFVKRRFMEIKN